MNILIAYDSYFGNTERVAEIIRDKFSTRYKTKAKKITNINLSEDLQSLDLLIIGSPMRAFQPSDRIVDFIDSLKKIDLDKTCIAIFDTRRRQRDIKNIFSRKINSIMIRLFGRVDKKIAKQVQKLKIKKIVEPTIGFYVTDVKGPLAEGQYQRIDKWVQKIINNI